MTGLPFISVIVPLLNEEECIERLTRLLLDQRYPADRYELLMSDGGSTDRTVEILRSVDPSRRIRMLPNPGRTAPEALNHLMAVARGDIIVRVDGHSYVAPAYLRRIVEVMAETGEAFVGGPVLMHADTPFRRALACALCSHIGVGSVPYRTLRRRSYVASIQTGAFRREVWERVGPFDVDLAVVEDLDFNTRAGRAGYRLLLDPSIRFWYVPRANLRGVWQQIVGVGRIKPRVLFKHPGIFKLKYAMPSLLVVVLAVCALAMLAAALGGAPRAGPAGALASGVYAAVIVGFTLGRLPRLGRAAWWLPAIVPALHVGYGVGFRRGLAALPRRRARLSAPPADHIAPAIGP